MEESTHDLVKIENSATTAPEMEGPAQPQHINRLHFWLILGSLLMCTFLAALDYSSISNALPTIVSDIHGENFIWVGSAFLLGSTAFIPLSGALAQAFGRRGVVLGSVSLFAVGSGICGGARNMNMLIAGRTVQGVGGGGILSLTEIVVADLVPLKDRGPYIGLVGAVWAIAAAIGPPIGGAFSESNWRWLFYLNLPLSGIALTLVFFFMRLKTPKADFRTKLKSIDWIGNILVIASTTICVLALTWAGVTHPWSSRMVLVPLIIGLAGLGIFVWYEAKIAKDPVVPWQLLNNRTSFFGYATVFLHGLVATCLIYYGPVFFQASLMQTPVRAGVSFFPNSFTIAPGAIICGLSIATWHVYRPQNFIGWSLLSIGMGLLTLITALTPKAQWVGFQLVEGFGIGCLYAAPKFSILAPLPIKESAHALALFIFVRSFSQTWGVAIGGTILQNELKKRLPSELLANLPQNIEISFALIPDIKHLPDPLQLEVRQAFAGSLRVIWVVLTVVSGVGVLCVLAMKEVKMAAVTDEDWGMDVGRPKMDVESPKAPLTEGSASPASL